MSFQLVLDILFVVLAAFFIGLGIHRGFIKSLIRSAKVLLSFVLAYFLGDKLGLLFKNGFIGNWVYDSVYRNVDEVYQNTASAMNADELLSHFPNVAATDEVRQTIAEATSSETGTSLVETVSSAISDPISTAISNVLGYLLVFVLALVGLSVAAWLLSAVIERIAFLGLANRILGGVWGALTGALILFVLASVIKLLFGGTEVYASSVVVRWFGDSGILQVLRIFDIGSLMS